jgi:hypothetical protein
MIEWNIQARAHACQGCAAPFADKQPYHTLLFDERRAYARVDVCERCWSGQYSEGATSRKGFVSHWQGVYEAPAPRPDPIQKATAESLLRKLTERNEPRDMAARFILAVMLERKRLLKVKDQLQHDGQRVFVYEHPGTGEVFLITDPALRLDQLDDVRRDVTRLLEEGVDAPAPAAETPAGAAPEPARPAPAAEPA